MHLDPEKIAKTNLGDVIRDVLVVHQVGVGDFCLAWQDGCVGLEWRLELACDRSSREGRGGTGEYAYHFDTC